MKDTFSAWACIGNTAFYCWQSPEHCMYFYSTLFLESINYSSKLSKYKHDDFFSGLTMILLQWILDFSGYLILMCCNKSGSFMIGSELHTIFFHIICPTLIRFLRVTLLKISDNFNAALDWFKIILINLNIFLDFFSIPYTITKASQIQNELKIPKFLLMDRREIF